MADSMFCATCLEEFPPKQLTVSPDDLLKRCFGCARDRTKGLPAPDEGSLGQKLHARAMQCGVVEHSWVRLVGPGQGRWEIFAEALEDEKLTDKDVLEIGGGQIVATMADLKGRKFERTRIVTVLREMGREMTKICPWSDDSTILEAIAMFIEARQHFKGKWATGNNDPPEFQE